MESDKKEGLGKILQVDETSVRSLEQGKRSPSKTMQQKIDHFAGQMDFKYLGT